MERRTFLKALAGMFAVAATSTVVEAKDALPLPAGTTAVPMEPAAAAEEADALGWHRRRRWRRRRWWGWRRRRRRVHWGYRRRRRVWWRRRRRVYW